MPFTENRSRTIEEDPEVTTAELAGFWSRCAAHLIDVLLIAAVCWGISYIIGRIATREDPFHSMPILLYTFFSLAGGTSLLYFPFMWKGRGQTLGKIALGIRVIRTDASPLSLESSLIRWLGYIISWATLFTLFIWVAFDGKRQGIHDKMADTYVIVVPKKKVRAHHTQTYAAAERV